MLQRKSEPVTTSPHGYLVCVEIEDAGPTTPEQVSLRLAGELNFMEGVGRVDVDYLGKIDQIGEDVKA